MSADRPINRCLPQINCFPGQSSSNICVTTITPAKQRCNQASPGYYLNNGVVQSCTNQSNCSQHLSNVACIGTNNTILPCSSPQPGYEVINGFVHPGGCTNVNQNPYPTTSLLRNVWNPGNCGNTLQSGASCQPICNTGYTSSPTRTTCNLGTVTKTMCLPNPCNGTALDQSGNVSIRPNVNPHSPGTEEYNAWNRGNCGTMLSSGGNCTPICSPSTQFLSVPNQSSCSMGSLTSAMCQKRPCPSGTPIDINVSAGPSSKRITLRNQLASNTSVTIPCSGDSTYTELQSWSDRYTGNITLTCNKGALSGSNTCAFYTACSSPFKSRNCEMGSNGICNVISGNQTCDCNSSSVGTGMSPQLLHLIIGIGHPQYLCLETPQSLNLHVVLDFPEFNLSNSSIARFFASVTFKPFKKKEFIITPSSVNAVSVIL